MAAQSGCSSEDIPLPDGKLPGDLMVSILCLLPVKPVTKFKSVSKRWNSLISSPSFIKRHLLNHSLIPNNLLMTLGDYGHTDFAFLIHNHDIDVNHVCYHNEVCILETRTLFGSKVNSLNMNIIDSCNGLVCLYDDRSLGLILWNPTTRKHRSIDLPEKGYTLLYHTLGLCYVEAINDFKIMGWTDIHNPGNQQYLFVYTLVSDSWEKSDYDAKKDSLRIRDQLPAFVNGCMHWLGQTSCTCVYLCTCKSVIMAFDVLDGGMSLFGVPDNGGGSEFELLMQTLVIQGCLAVAIFTDYLGMGSGFEIWVMEEYGVERSWVKQFTVEDSSDIKVPLMWLNDGEIGFTSARENSDTLTFYDPSSKEKRRHGFTSLYVYQMYNYVESLASVGTKAENAPV